MATSIREIADLAGVSQTTVSLVLNDKDGVSPETRERVKRLIKEHNYHPGEPYGKRSRIETVCIVRFTTQTMPVEDQGFILSCIENLYDECYRNKIKPFVMICNADSYKEVMANAVSEKNDAIIVIAMEMRQEHADYIGKMDFKGTPAVVIGSGMFGTNLSSINLANSEESYYAVEYLHEIGYPTVGYLHSVDAEWGFLERAVGFDKAAADFGMEDPLKINLESTISGAYRMMREWLKKRLPMPRAFFADNDNTALGAMKALTEAGYRVPEDISLIGMDDIVYSAFASCPLTTIHISRSQIARTTVAFLMGDPPEIPVRISCKGRLVIRDSTRSFDASVEERFIRK